MVHTYQVVIQREQFCFNYLLQLSKLAVLSLKPLLVNSLNLFYCFLKLLWLFVLHILQIELAIVSINFLEDIIRSTHSSDRTKYWCSTLINHVSYMLAHVKKIAGTFVAFSTKCFLHYIFMGCLRDSVVIKFPPKFLGSVINVWVVMPVFRQSIVNNYCVQIVRSLFFFYVGFFEYLFNMLNFFF